ncbi:PREDICTED: small glutamine-rich tetratricopeptide repeat-containing protein 2 [Tarenaya hassleriana]|uniref:small glutamine-rich tetratricopeptide repeat-containing protein 2 n=1 Tax=Tarenaya hassleriana TaxID=28532 RepID=UPI00053C9CDB|nr:PREDICTED: small glutamine-rich tetratricopeptide repeat-containing protein 2 [Tarenaya hassleriana]
MAKLTTETPICRRIVRSFLDFLDAVEASPGVDEEGLEVAKECLAEAFKINLDSVGDDQIKPVSLINMFSALDKSEHQEDRADVTRNVTIDGPSSSSGPNLPSSCVSETQRFSGDLRAEPQFTGTSRDELFGQFFGALEKIRFFRNTSDGDDDPALLEKATRIFHDAINEMEKSGCQTFDAKNLAETLKSQGNKAMQSKLYSEAIELYSFAIALWGNNAVFYCNRAAAYTQINKYNEAIKDCLKSIDIDPNYSKAYSRLGLAYYAQGKYAEAIEKGFKKALQLDPHNESVKENIRVAEQKLTEEQQRQRHSQNSSTGQNQEPNNHFPGGASTRGQFSMPFNPEFMNMLMNMTGNAFHGDHSHNNQENDGNTSPSDEPEIRVGGNINIELGQEMPEEFSSALRSMMQMFGGSQQQGTTTGNNNNTQDANDEHGRPSSGN